MRQKWAEFHRFIENMHYMRKMVTAMVVINCSSPWRRSLRIIQKFKAINMFVCLILTFYNLIFFQTNGENVKKCLSRDSIRYAFWYSGMNWCRGGPEKHSQTIVFDENDNRFYLTKLKHKENMETTQFTLAKIFFLPLSFDISLRAYSF